MIYDQVIVPLAITPSTRKKSKNSKICAYPSCTNKVKNKPTYKVDQLKGVRNPQYCCSFCAKQHKLIKRDINLKRQKLISRKTKKPRRLKRKRA
jgi:hypothetical protein